MMVPRIGRRIGSLACMALILAVAACSAPAYEPMTYTDVSEMGAGPGLFTGPEGAFVLYHESK